MAFSHILGMIMSTIILTILWIVGFGIYAVILKIVTLPARFRKSPDSYWIGVTGEHRKECFKACEYCGNALSLLKYA